MSLIPFPQGANGAAGNRDALGARNAASGSEGPVDGFELSIRDRAANPTRGELVLDLAEGRGLAQVRLDTQRFGTSVLQGAQARFDSAGGSVRLSGIALPDPVTGLPDPRIAGLAYRNLPHLGIDIGPPAFASYKEFALTYIHELGHASLNLGDYTGGLTAYQFEKSQFRYITQRKLGLLP